MKILLVGAFQHPMYAPAFESGFKALGHEVLSIKYEDYLYGASTIGNFLSRVQTRFHYGIHLYKYNNDVIRSAESFNPDYIFLYRCYNIWPSTVVKLKKAGCFVFTYNNDDPFNGIPDNYFYRYFHLILPLVDINYIYRKKNFIDYEKAGSRNTKLLLPYFIEKNNFFEDCEDDIPIAFLGHFENDGRDKYIKALIDADIPVKVFNGSDWQNAPLFEDIKNCIESGKRGIEYNHTINRCKIALVFLSKLNSDTYTRRCFEIPATKTLMLSEYTDDLNEMFPSDECAVYFKSMDDLVEKCKLLLLHPEEINRIANNGYNRLIELGGSEVDRCKQIVETYKNQK